MRRRTRCAAHIRLYLAFYLGQVQLTDLSASYVRAMFTATIRQHQALGSPVAAATLYPIRATLRAALNAAVCRGLIADNPAGRAELRIVCEPVDQSDCVREDGAADPEDRIWFFQFPLV